MRSALAVLTAAAVLSVPALALAGDDDYRDRDRHHDRDCDGRDYDCGYHDRYDDDWNDNDYHHGDRDDRDCPDSFDFVLAFDRADGGRDRGDHYVCCKVVGHGWKKAVLCFDPDDNGNGYHDYD